jgi:hypothetical protein
MAKESDERNEVRNGPRFGYLRGTMRIDGDIVSPDPEAWDSDLGIAYRAERRKPVYCTGTGTEVEDDRK